MTAQQRSGGEHWGPWVIHDGKGCPLPSGTIVEVVSEDGFGFASREIACVSGGEYSSWNWRHYPELKRIIRFRVKKPRGLEMLEERLQTLDAPKSRTAPKRRAPQDETAQRRATG
ncbi:hypothetical protein [Sagittula sp. S175]|uniref:hypothetical protein n=1 Tax=Sagittula sp. S175 TaxID=3415129 RepID=UPI003C7C0772